MKRCNKFLTVLLVMALAMSLVLAGPLTPSPAGATLPAAGQQGLIAADNPAEQGVKIQVDGKFLTFDVPPLIENGRTLVPVRALFENLGALVKWDQETRTVTAVKENLTVRLTIGSNLAYVNDKPVTLDVPAKIVNSRTLVPIRFVSESLGAKVTWNAATRLVSVATPAFIARATEKTAEKVAVAEKPTEEVAEKPGEKPKTPSGGGGGGGSPAKPAKEELVIALDKYSPSKVFKVAGCTQIYEPLLFLNRSLEIQPGLISSWERVDDYTWRLQVRRGVKFHNGKEFDAESAKFAFTIYLDQLKTGYVGQRVSQVVDSNSFNVVDKYTLEIKTLKPYPFLANLMTHGWIAGYDPEAISNREVVGTGPFKFKEEVKDQYVVVERNDEYWGEKPFFKRIKFVPIADANTRVMALQRGTVDVVLYPPYSLIDELRRDFNVVVAPRGCTALLLFNHNRPQMQDTNLRKALCMAFEKDKIVNTVFYGTASPAKAIIPPEATYSAEREIQGWSYNPTEAKRLIKEAGYKETADGFIDRDGRPLKLRFTYFAPEEGYKKLAEAIASYYEKIGVKTDIVGLDSSAYYTEVCEKGNYDICLDMVGLFWGSPSTMLYDQFYSKSGLIGHHRVKDEEIDRLLEEGMELESRKEITKAAEKYKAVQKRALEELVASCPIAYQKHIVVSKKNVKGLSPFPTYGMYFNGDAEKELVKVRWGE